MRVPAQLHQQAGGGRRPEIDGHQVGGPAVEGEGGGDHAAEADRHQPLLPSPVPGPDDVERIGPIGRRRPLAM
jgi:hypothetical protein